MNLIWHLIKKDLRALRWWLVLWTLACGTHLALRLIQLASGDAALPANFAVTGRPDHLALYVLMLLIAPQIVQLDPPVSGRAFWKTLPIARWRLLVGKVLLLLAFFVVLPTVCEVAYFVAAGFGEFTKDAVSIWAWRALPPLALVLGASVLSRDLRITALIVAAAAIMLPVGGLNLLVTGWRPEVMRVAIPFSVITVAAIGIALLVWQYLAAGRFMWPILVTLIGVGWWNKPTAPLPMVASSYQQPTVSVPASKAIQMPSGMQVDVSSLPPTSYQTNVSDNPEAKWKGTNFRFGITVSNLPKDTDVSTVWIDQESFKFDGKTYVPRPSNLDESIRLIVSGRRRVLVAHGEKPVQLSVSVGLFDLEAVDWKSKPAELKGVMKLRLIKTTRLASFPVKPGVLWSGTLDSLTVKSIERVQRTFRANTDFSSVDIPASTLETTPLVPPGTQAIFEYVRKDGLRRQGFGSLTNPMSGPLTWTGSGGGVYRYSNNGSSFGAGYESPPGNGRLDLTRRVRQFAGVSGMRNERQNGSFTSFVSNEREDSLYQNPDDWEIQLVTRSEEGAIEIPIEFTNINPPEAQWIHAKNRETESLGETLDSIVLKNAPAPADVEEYVRKLCLATRVSRGAHIEHHENTILVKLYAVGAENIPTLIRWAKLHATPLGDWENTRVYNDGGWELPVRGESAYRYDQPSKHTIGAYLVRVINDLARPADKDLLLAEHSPALDFLPAISEHGWKKDAIAVMCDRASDEPLPGRWMDILIDSDSPKVNAAFIAQCRIGGMSLDWLERASRREGFPTREAVSLLWHAASERAKRPIHLVHLFAFLCKHGGGAAPGDLALILAEENNGVSIYDKENADIKGEMARIMSWRSDCPPTAEAARIWLNKNAANMRFNDATGRYELTNSNP